MAPEFPLQRDTSTFEPPIFDGSGGIFNQNVRGTEPQKFRASRCSLSASCAFPMGSGLADRMFLQNPRFDCSVSLVCAISPVVRQNSHRLPMSPIAGQ